MILTNTGNTERLVPGRRDPATEPAARTGTGSSRPDSELLTGSPAHPQALRLRVHRPEPGVAVVLMSGEVDLAGAPRLNELIRQRLTAAVLRALVLDMSEVSFFGSAGLELLLLAQSRCESRGIPMYLVPGHGVVARMLRLTGLADRFATRETTAQAVAELRGAR